MRTKRSDNDQVIQIKEYTGISKEHVNMRRYVVSVEGDPECLVVDFDGDPDRMMDTIISLIESTIIECETEEEDEEEEEEDDTRVCDVLIETEKKNSLMGSLYTDINAMD